MRSALFPLACALALAFSTAAQAQTVSFERLALFGGTAQALGASGDGAFIVGTGAPPEGGRTDAYRWVDGTVVNIGTASGSDFSFATGVSADGRAVAGYTAGATRDAFRWTADDGLLTLGTGEARAIADDGAVVVGTTTFGESGVDAFRWTADTGMQPLGALPGGNLFSRANDISASGDVIVGSISGATSNGQEAFRWTPTAGIVSLGVLQDDHQRSDAFGVSPDGQVVVGRSTGFGRPIKAFRWTAAQGMQDLGAPANGSNPEARATSLNGEVVVGLATRFGVIEGTYWTEARGMQWLDEALAERGLDVGGLTRLAPADISADGLVIVGTGFDAGGQRVAWRAVLGSNFFVEAPADDEIVPPGEPYTVRFSASGIDTVDLYVVTNSQDSNGTRTLLAEDVPVAGGTYSWEVDEGLLSPSTFLIAVNADNPDEEVVSERFRVRPPYRLARVAGTVANPEYELFRFSRHAFSFDQAAEVLWPTAYWDRTENAYDNNAFGFDPLIPPIGAVRYDEEYFYDRTAAAYPTWEAFARAFGFAGAYASTSTIEFGGLTIHQVNPNAAGVWRGISGTGLLGEQTSYNGACYGFAMAVLAGFSSPEAFTARWLPLTGQRTLADVPLTNEVRDAIHSLWTYTSDRRLERRAIDNLVADPVSPRAVLAQLKARLESDVRDLDRVLVFQGAYRNPDGTTGEGAHAVVPIDLLDVIDLGGGSEIGVEDDGLYWIPVMDPNYDVNASPNSAIAFVEIDSTAATWSHLELRDGALFQTEWLRGNAEGLYLSGLGIEALEPARPTWPVVFEEDPAAPSTAASRAAPQRRADELIVRIAAGNSGLSGPGGEVSFRDGTLTETLPGGGALFPITGRPARPFAYVAPPGRYTVDLVPGPSGRSLLTVEDRRTLTVARLDGTPGADADRVEVGGDTLSVAAGQAGLLRLDARLTVESTGGTVVRTFAADSLQAAPGLRLGVSALADSAGFRVGSNTAVTYDLALGQAGPGGRRSFYHANVPLPAGATHVVQPDWSDLGNAPVTVSVDLDGDGEPDETFELDNEGFPVTNEDEAVALPSVFSMAAYPNPARDAATVAVALPEAADVRVEVFDVLGRRVAMLHDGPLSAGAHLLALDAVRLPAGVYVVRAATPDATLARRITVVG
ncbi:MAG: Ser-Thr-rich GPI-anchored membrane family protein [Bacteroidota bacterium]